MDGTTIIGGINNDQPNEEVRPKRTKLILKALTEEQKSSLNSIGLVGSGALLGSLINNMISSGFSTKEDAILIAKNDQEYVPQSSEEELCVELFIEVPFATEINDEMTFTEAFSTARGELGPGGFFEWKGATYNTYYKEEWDHLGEDRQQEYYSNLKESADYENVSIVNNQPLTESHNDLEGGSISSTQEVNDIDTKPDPEVPPEKPEVPSYAENNHKEDSVVKPTALKVDTNNDGIPDAIVYDINDDDYADAILIDVNQDGTPEYLYDSDENQDIDIMVIDTDNDGAFSDEVQSPLSEELTLPVSSLNVLDEEEYAEDNSQIEKNLPDLENDYPIDEFI
ncbi:MAG: hypothetical protein ACI86M_002097 [Saprospiraceae bacterium]|jgi:hypothetical protein